MVDISDFRKPEPKRSGREEETTLTYMKRSRRWLLWKYGPIRAPGLKPAKIPYYSDGGLREDRLDTPEDLDRLTSYDEARAQAKGSGGTMNLGFAFGPDGGGGNWQGFDSDGSLEGMDKAPGYVERSPSGTGYHVIGYGRPFKTRVEPGLEYYSQARYFTFTGDEVSDGPLVDLYEAAGSGPPPAEQAVNYDRPVQRLTDEQYADLKLALKTLDPDPYFEWVRVALALQKVEGGLQMFLSWSRGSAKHKDAEATRKFERIGMPTVHWKSIFLWAKETGNWPPHQSDARAAPAAQLSQEDVDTESAPWVEYVLKDFIPAGCLVVGGMYGVGKTSQLLSLILRAAGCLAVDDQWKPDLRRRVIYFTESMTQIRRLLHGLRKSGMIGVSDAELGRWIRFYPVPGAFPVRFWEGELARLSTENTVLQEVGDGGEPLPVAPLFVIDTVPNLILIKSENDNSEIAQTVTALRVAAGAASVWLVTHLAKAMRDADPGSYSARGASAWGAGTEGEIFIYSNPDDPEDGSRYIRLGKDRVGVQHRQVKITTQVFQGESTFRTFTERFTAYLGGEMVPFTDEERKDEGSSSKEAQEHGKLMAAVSRFKKILAEAPGEGLAVSHAKGPSEPPAGYAKTSWNDVLKGMAGKDVGFRAKFIDAVVEGFRPADDGRYYTFRKPSFGMGGAGEPN